MGTPRSRFRASLVQASGEASRWLRDNAYLLLVCGALLVVAQVVSFTPPPEVRMAGMDSDKLVGDAQRQEFSGQLNHPQSVQIRASLRMYPDPELPVSHPDPELDQRGQLLSQPMVTTMFGMHATIEQSVRLEGGDLEIRLAWEGTPRIQTEDDEGRQAPLLLEHHLKVTSRRQSWWQQRAAERTHLDTWGVLHGVDDDGHRVVFAVDDHLFSLDLELHRP